MACRERFFGGRIEVEWERQENAFNMDLIDRVLLKSNRNHLIFSKFMIHLENISQCNFLFQVLVMFYHRYDVPSLQRSDGGRITEATTGPMTNPPPQ